MHGGYIVNTDCANCCSVVPFPIALSPFQFGCTRALLHMPYSMRLLYVHSFTSLLWNRLATHRMHCYGNQAVKGDLVEVNPRHEAGSNQLKQDVRWDGLQLWLISVTIVRGTHIHSPLPRPPALLSKWSHRVMCPREGTPYVMWCSHWLEQTQCCRLTVWGGGEGTLGAWARLAQPRSGVGLPPSPFMQARGAPAECWSHKCFFQVSSLPLSCTEACCLCITRLCALIPVMFCQTVSYTHTHTLHSVCPLMYKGSPRGACVLHAYSISWTVCGV